MQRPKFTSLQRLTVASEQKWLCNICQCHLPAAFQIDHIVPLSEHGAHDRMNWQALCANCHASKSAFEQNRRIQSVWKRAAKLQAQKTQDDESDWPSCTSAISTTFASPTKTIRHSPYFDPTSDMYIPTDTVSSLHRQIFRTLIK